MTWTKKRTVLVAGVVALIVVAIPGLYVLNSGDFEARSILKKSYKKYDSLTSYRSIGHTTDEIGEKVVAEASFSMRLAHPDYYLVEYLQTASHYTNKAAVWFDGTGHFFTNQKGDVGLSIQFPDANLANNIDRVADISGGVTAVVPAVYFHSWHPNWTFSNWMARRVGKKRKTDWSVWTQPAGWGDLKLVKTNGMVGNVDCHVLSARFDNGGAMLWIGKQDFLIHRSKQWLKGKLPEATDGEMTRMLQGVTQLPLPLDEMKERINKGRKQAESTMQPVTVVFGKTKLTNGGSSIESVKIEPPALRVYTQQHDVIVLNEPFSPTNFVCHSIYFPTDK